MTDKDKMQRYLIDIDVEAVRVVAREMSYACTERCKVKVCVSGAELVRLIDSMHEMLLQELGFSKAMHAATDKVTDTKGE